MIEKKIYDFLSERASVPVYMTEPAEGIADEYILIHKSGGRVSNRIRSALLLVKCISTKSLYRAAEICEEVISLMDDAVTLDEVASCTPNSPGYNNSDTASMQYRYDATFDITHY